MLAAGPRTAASARLSRRACPFLSFHVPFASLLTPPLSVSVTGVLPSVVNVPGQSRATSARLYVSSDPRSTSSSPTRTEAAIV